VGEARDDGDDQGRAVEGFSDAAGDGDGMGLGAVPVVGDRDSSVGRDGLEVGPEVVEVGQRRVTAVAGHVGGHRQGAAA